MVALVVKSLELVHVEGSVQVLEAVVLDFVGVLLVAVRAHVDVHFHLRISAVRQSVHMAIARHQGTLVKVSTLVDSLLSGAVELHHHGAVHFGAGSVHSVCVHAIECSYTRLGVRLGRVLACDLEHVLVGLTAHMLI